MILWQKAHQLTLSIYKATNDFPSEEKYGLSAQIRRSSASVCANICEGYRKSRKDFVRYLEIAQGSLEETKYHLILSNDLNYCSNSNYDKLLQSSDEVGKILYGFIKQLRLKL